MRVRAIVCLTFLVAASALGFAQQDMRAELEHYQLVLAILTSEVENLSAELETANASLEEARASYEEVAKIANRSEDPRVWEKRKEAGDQLRFVRNEVSALRSALDNKQYEQHQTKEMITAIQALLKTGLK